MDERIQVTIDDVIEDIKASAKIEKSVPEGLTAAQFAERLGYGEKKCAKELKKLVQAGKLKVTRVRIQDVTGRDNFSFIYHP